MLSSTACLLWSRHNTCRSKTTQVQSVISLFVVRFCYFHLLPCTSPVELASDWKSFAATWRRPESQSPQSASLDSTFEVSDDWIFPAHVDQLVFKKKVLAELFMNEFVNKSAPMAYAAIHGKSDHSNVCTPCCAW